MPAPAPSAQAARQASATKTIFGMPAAEIIKARAAAEAAKAAAARGRAAARRPNHGADQPGHARGAAARGPAARAAAAPHARAAPARMPPPGVAPSAGPAPVARAVGRQRDQDDLRRPDARRARWLHAGDAAERGARARPPTRDRRAGAADDRGKTGARKVSVPGPEVAARRRRRATIRPPRARGYGAAAAAEAPKRTVDARARRQAGARARRRAAAAAAEKTRPAKRETPIWTYVGVGFTFGLALIGIYQLVGVLAH